MSWRIDLSRNAEKFLVKNELTIAEAQELKDEQKQIEDQLEGSNNEQEKDNG